MNKKSKILLYLFSSLGFSFISLVLYLTLYESMDENLLLKTNTFVSLTALPDLALTTENYALRHRTMSDISSIYCVDGTLRESSFSSFSIANSKER